MSFLPSAAFSTARRGYDPEQVDQTMANLTSELEAAKERNSQLEQRVRELEAQTSALQGEAAGNAPSYVGLGTRIEQMLALAHEEAEQVRATAREDATAALEGAVSDADQIRAETDRYAQERHSEADAESARVLEEARRAADQMRDDAERDTRTFREEAEALFERNRAKVAQAAADFETTLSHRRDQAQRDFTQQMNANHERLAAVEQRAEQLRIESEKQRADADRRATQVLEGAQRRADELVAQARAQAERVRLDSERELAAATQRRDSINAQLTNVRQMLATLTGATLPNPAEDDEASADQTAEGETDVIDLRKAAADDEGSNGSGQAAAAEKVSSNASAR